LFLWRPERRGSKSNRFRSVISTTSFSFHFSNLHVGLNPVTTVPPTSLASPQSHGSNFLSAEVAKDHQPRPPRRLIISDYSVSTIPSRLLVISQGDILASRLPLSSVHKPQRRYTLLIRASHQENKVQNRAFFF
jgi:hypothetical protein